MRETTTTTDVLVVGAGPAGLATAVSALRHGARVLVVERRPDTSSIPRATGVSTRTMEILRTWGLADAVRARAIDADPEVAIGPTLVDSTRMPAHAIPSLRAALAVSPTHPLACPQDHLEPVLVEEVRRLGGEVRFATAFAGLRAGPGGVRADLRGGGQVRARFVVGADGPRSPVRTALGVGVDHLGTIGDFVQALFRADIGTALGRRPAAIAFLSHPDAPGVLLPVGDGRWTFVQERTHGAGERSAARWVAVIRAATGMPGLDVELLGTQTFTMAADVAARLRSGLGFLVGDAAHRMSPAAGVGMNTAVHDGHELGWKLAWVLDGRAGDALLDSWAAERGPVGRANAERSLRLTDTDPGDGLPIDLGRTYRSSAILTDLDGDPPPHRTDRAARPGERAPHAWVRRDGRRVCTLDLLADRLTLLVGSDDAGWARAAQRIGPPVTTLVVGRELVDHRGALARGYRLGPGSAVLVRPDGVVAWRHDGPCPDHRAALGLAVATALGRAGPARARVAG